jgi:3-oxoacyl-[acyl-carrier protein] reductase
MSLSGFTRSLAREVGGLGITANDMAPGFLATDMTRGLAEEQRQPIAPRSGVTPPGGSRGRGERRRLFCSATRRANISGAVLTINAGATA